MNDPRDRLGHGIRDLRLGQHDLAGHTARDVASSHIGRDVVGLRRPLGGADLHLHPLGRALADQQIVVAADVGRDRFVHLVAADSGQIRSKPGPAARSLRPRSCRHRYRRPSSRSGRAPARPAPIAAAIGSSISETLPAPAFETASRIARRSTDVAPEGTQITTSGLLEKRLPPACALLMKCLIICSATSRSAITPAPQGPDGFDVVRRLAHHKLGVVANCANFAKAVDAIPWRPRTARCMTMPRPFT